MEAFERLVAHHVAASDLGVLVVGEPGVGKGVTAQAIHARSRRAARSVRRDRLRAAPRQISSESSSAPTRARARSRRPPAGTILLDEILAAPLATQEKLVPWLERARAADVRVLASTSRDAEERVRARPGFLRELYLRLNGVTTLAVPPLRVRRGRSR